MKLECRYWMVLGEYDEDKWWNVRKAEPKLKLNLAQKALYRYFEKNPYSEEYRMNIMQYCKESMSNDNLIKLSMRITKEQNNNK